LRRFRLSWPTAKYNSLKQVFSLASELTSQPASGSRYNPPRIRGKLPSNSLPENKPQIDESKMTPMTTTTNSNVTQLLVDWRNGNQSALNQLMPLVYDELRGLAKRYLRRENASHTLQTNALVNEAYLRLVNQQGVDWQNRAHFFAMPHR
jgi:hypothetical protein